MLLPLLSSACNHAYNAGEADVSSAGLLGQQQQQQQCKLLLLLLLPLSMPLVLLMRLRSARILLDNDLDCLCLAVRPQLPLVPCIAAACAVVPW
jgi:hypothetical protein